MKVLFVSHFFPPRHRAGVEIYTARLVRKLADRGHEVAVFHTEKDISRRDGRLLRETFEPGAGREPGRSPTRPEEGGRGFNRYVVINNLLYRSLRDTYENPAVEQAFAEVLDEFAPEVVHFHHLLHLSSGLPKQAKERGLAVVMTLHDFWLQCPRSGQMLFRGEELCEGPEDEKCAECLVGFKLGQSRLERIAVGITSFLRERVGINLAPLAEKLRPVRAGIRSLIKRKDGSRDATGSRGASATKPEVIAARNDALRETADNIERFLCPSRIVADHLVRWGLPADRVRYSPLGIDTERFRPQPREHRARELHVGFLGTIAPHKGVHVLVEAANRLPRLAVDIWGRTSFFPDYVRQLKENRKSDGIRFRGEASIDEIPKILGATDVLVVPSIWYENSPLTILEAFACGVPVIASDLGGMAELVDDGVSGYLFPPGDDKALAEKLRHLHENSERVRELSESVPNVKSLETDAQEHEKIYAELNLP